jgi:hypothetical protein
MPNGLLVSVPPNPPGGFLPSSWFPQESKRGHSSRGLRGSDSQRLVDSSEIVMDRGEVVMHSPTGNVPAARLDFHYLVCHFARSVESDHSRLPLPSGQKGIFPSSRKFMIRLVRKCA